LVELTAAEVAKRVRFNDLAAAGRDASRVFF
jgi:hypothetical protein